MAKIPGVAYIIVGIIISVYSKLMVSKTGKDPFLDIFFYIGAFFVFVGVVKIIFARSKKEKPINKFDSLQSMPLKKQTTPKQTTPIKPTQQTSQNVLFCPRCGAKHYSTSNFCHLCGSRLR
ncbi:MAG: zinc-ribbon domain-containing protein [Nanoarchaeota archaeon]|nr:zinc-ribbon domain-containing protein [Nanoarchaeota archaeon]MBU1030744.1 zinc-ribbon domain-containing protein [Nanoarchaeota archaeon]MBU1849921.1 zinc-ribbon domain-containing protein [Nanoarchaeota archaeon]